MNRRRLILTSLGALAGCLGLPKVALAAVERNQTFTSPKTAAAIEPLIRSGIPSHIVNGKWVGPPSFEELFVPCSGTVDEALQGLVSCESQTPRASWPRATIKAGPQVMIGQLIVSNEAEAEAFLAQIAASIRASAIRKAQDG